MSLKVMEAVKPAAKSVQAAPTHTQKVDELLTLSYELAKLDAKIKRRDELKKEFASLANDEFEAEEVAIFYGTKGSLEFGARSKSRKIVKMNDLIGKLKDKVGYEGLLTLLRLTLGDCEKYLSKEELKPFLKEEEGSRIFKGITITDPTML